MYETILDATARILVKQGFAAATTNAIAERAGISVGSLYQYFPNRQALVAAVAQRHSERVKGNLDQALIRSAEMPLRAGLEMLMQAVGEAHNVDPALNRVLAEELPRLGNLDWKMEMGRRGIALVQAFLQSHNAELRRGLDAEDASFLISTLVESTLNAAYRYGKVAPSRDKILSGLTEMIYRYLAADSRG